MKNLQWVTCRDHAHSGTVCHPYAGTCCDKPAHHIWSLL